MSKKSKLHQKRKVSFKLNTQFSLVVILSTVLGYATIFAVFNLTEPIYNTYLKPFVDEVNMDLLDIEQEVKLWGEETEIYIVDEEVIPEIDEMINKYPQYKIKYKGFINKTVQDLQQTNHPPEIITASYAVTYLQVENGAIIVGVTIPELGKWIAGLIFSIIVLYILVQLSIIGLYAKNKAKYLKTMTAKLEVIAGGDLDIRVPVKGKDEMAQLAWHINEMTAALQAQINKEKEIENTKKQLITNISHDLRTPLTVVMGYLNLLDEMNPEKDAEKMKQYIHTVHLKSEDISHLVDQLFDYVLLSNRQTDFRCKVMEPSLLWQQLFMDSENMLASKNIQITYRLNPGINIWTDVNQLKRVTDNVLQNISKYGLKDSIVEITGSGDQQAYTLVITNQSETQLDQTGEDFMNRYFTTDRITGKSAGLGLAICKEIIEQHGGNLQITTQEKTFQMHIIMPNKKEVNKK